MCVCVDEFWRMGEKMGHNGQLETNKKISHTHKALFHFISISYLVMKNLNNNNIIINKRMGQKKNLFKFQQKKIGMNHCHIVGTLTNQQEQQQQQKKRRQIVSVCVCFILYFILFFSFRIPTHTADSIYSIHIFGFQFFFHSFFKQTHTHTHGVHPS